MQVDTSQREQHSGQAPRLTTCVEKKSNRKTVWYRALERGSLKDFVEAKFHVKRKSV
jgi:hypothetical protein